MKYALIAAVAALLGVAVGWQLPGETVREWLNPPPAYWIARIDSDYIQQDQFVDAMRRRGGTRPGQFHDMAQKQALLDALLYRQAVVMAARAEGLDREPTVRHALEQILTNQYLQRHLRPRQENVQVSEAEVAAAYARRQDDYAVPARRRVAMIRVGVPAKASPQARQRARQRAEAALAEARSLDAGIPDFGVLARKYSDDQASRYRGGVIGWIGEAAPARYRHDPVVVATANAMEEPGSLSPVLAGEDGFYVVRLVDFEPRRERSLEELADGIRQRLRQERFQQVEAAFREEMLGRFQVEIRPDALATIAPLGPPADDTERRPPGGPSQ